MRILFCSRRYFPAISGMSVYAQNLLRHLVAAGHDVTMVSQYRSDEFGTRVYGGGPPPPVPGVRVIGLEALGEQDGGDFERDIDRMVETIRAEHRRQPFDVLHAQYGYPTGWATVLAAGELGLPSVVSIQGGDGHWVGSCCETHRLAMQRVLTHADALLIGGASFIDEVAERLGTDRDRFTVVPGAVDTSLFRPAAERPSDEAEARLLYHGRVDRRKGALDFIEALALLRDHGVPFRAVISGIRPDVEAAQDLAAARGLPRDTMRFTGYVAYESVADLYRDANVFVSPTYAEGFSNTILEAMASGVAIVSCRSVGVVDCLRDGDNALLTEAGDVPTLAQTLGRLIGDAALRRRLAETALTECRRIYSWEAVAGRIMRVYDTVLAQRRGVGIDAALPRASCRFRAEPHLL